MILSVECKRRGVSRSSGLHLLITNNLKFTIMKDLRLNKRFGVQFAYLFDCIYSDEFDVNQMNDREKIEYMFEQYESEHGMNLYKKGYYRNEQECIEDWLRGLPTACKIEYCDYNIAQIGKSWGFCKTDRKAAEFVNNWFSVCALRLIQMRNALCK